MEKEKLNQEETPFLDALIDYVKSDPTPFDVPGHKMGNFKDDLAKKISPLFAHYDVNAPIGLDNLYHPSGVIQKAEALAAECCHAQDCLFAVNGTTVGILALLVAVLSTGDKIILPRNVHKSVINGLILSGAVPVFVHPDIDEKRGIACGVRTEDMILAMEENPDAKAVFVINPTYFGIVSDLKAIVREAHKRNMVVICDEAHGSNFYFSNELPCSAMDAGADLTALSMHKNSGSLTQSSFILMQGERVSKVEVFKAYSMFSSTSPNHLLLASLDASRKEMALHGKEYVHANLELAQYARKKLNQIPGLYVYGKEYVKERHNSGAFDIDLTKLVIDTTGLGLYGYQVYKEIRAQSNVQLELGEVSVVLACLGPGTTKEHIDNLIAAFETLSQKHNQRNGSFDIPHYKYDYAQDILSPRQAYDSPHRIIPLDQAVGQISAENVMAYPPGIPLVIPGELVSQDTVRMIEFFQCNGGTVLKDTAPDVIKVVGKDKAKKL